MTIFGDADFGEELFGDGGASPDVHPSERVAWQFFDGVSTYELPVNPNSATSPDRKRNLTEQATAAGSKIAYEGRRSPNVLTFSGDILEEAQYNAFRTWFRKRKQVRVRDDLGRSFWVYITGFSPQRQPSIQFEWMMTYTAEAFVLDRGAV